MMEFSGEFTVDETPEDLWRYVTDPDILMDCAPGCNKMELESPSHIVAGLTVGVGSVKPSFDVTGVVTECDRPNRVAIQATGEASRNSFNVDAWQELHDNGDGTTTVTWEAEAEISGIIASMGERAIGSVTDKLVNQFFRSLEEHVETGTPAESRLQAASSEETELAEQATASSGDDAAGGANALVGKAVGGVVSAVDDGPTSGQSLVAGIGLGLLGSSLWHRLRGSSQQPTVSDEQPSAAGQETARSRSGDAGDGRSSLLVLGLAAALGAVGAVVWSRSQSASESVEDIPTPDVADDPDTDEVESPDDRTAADVERDGPTGGDDPEPENPLDRLESRP
jgi:carbon monoxide dehydrogenase subunit G